MLRTGRFVMCGLCWTVVCCAVAEAQPIRLARDPELSADGSLLYFSYRGDLWRVNSGGGRARRLTSTSSNERRPRISPDGKQLAFSSDRTGSRQVFVMPLNGGKARQLTFHTEGCELQQWDPDGESLLVLGTRDHFWRHAQRFFRIALEERTSEQTLFNAYGQEGSLSPDGKQLLFTREGERWWRKGYRGSRASQVWLFNLKTKKFRQILKRDSGCRQPLWKPDGTAFYYLQASGRALNVWEYNLADKESRQITEFEDDSVLMLCQSADGSTLVFRHLFDFYRLRPGVDDNPVRIKVRDVGDDETEDIQRQTLKTATSVTFSASGLELAFVAGGDVWVMDTELREPRQVTSTPEHESRPLFSHDGKTLYFISSPDGQSDIWKAERGDPKQHWWQNAEFSLTAVTNDAASESELALSPDGRWLAFVKERGDLWLLDTTTGKPRRLFQSFMTPSYDFSPDGRWLVYALSDNDFNRDIWIAPVDGSREPVNVSRHPDNEGNPVWSPDGKLVAFTGRRADDEVDIYYLWLTAEAHDKSSRARKLEKAIAKFQSKTKPAAGSSKPKADAKVKPPADPKPDQPAAVQIDFEGISRRLRRVPIPDSSESNLFWSPKGNQLAFTSSIGGKSGTYTIQIPDRLKPKLLSTTKGSSARWMKNNLIGWLASGVPATLSASGSESKLTFLAYHQHSRSARFRAGFDLSWRTMRDWWYDDRFDNRNWDAIRRKYRDQAGQSHDIESFSTVVHLMLGELNGSHLGFRASPLTTSNSQSWKVETAHLGVRFDPDFQGPGIKVHDVLPKGPADKHPSRLQAGDVIQSIDGVAVDPQFDLTQILTGRLSRDVALTVRGAADQQQKQVVLRPISYSDARRLLYDKWQDDNRRMVEQLSDGTMGYLHIQAMNWSSFLEFERELYAVGYGKQGLIIDVRENGGGFTTDHLLTALTQPRHALTVPRGGGVGYPQDRSVYATWSKPIVVMCNQNSFSNAEIFSHAIKGLKRGRLVGVPSAGGVISTGSAQIMDLGRLRRPFRGWFVQSTGADMELNGAVPDVIKWPQPGEWPSGRDVQLRTAAKVLGQEIKKWKARPVAKPQKASERRAAE